AVAAMSGPLHGGAPARVLHMIEAVERSGDAAGYVRGVLDRGERLMGFGHRVYRAEDPRARVLRETARRLGAPRFEVAAALVQAPTSGSGSRHERAALGRGWAGMHPATADRVRPPVRRRGGSGGAGGVPGAEADRPAGPLAVPFGGGRPSLAGDGAGVASRGL